MMTDQPKRSLATRELLGIALFTVAVVPLVLVILALVRPGAADAGGAAALARSIVALFGYFPAILAAGGAAGVGAALWLSGKQVDVGRHLAGFLFTALGLAICLGALSDEHGGAFGSNTGGALRGPIGAWAGLLVGGAVALVSIWLAWMGGRLDFSRNAGQSATLSDALSEKESDGVSEAEASALVPDDQTLAYMEQVWRRAPVQITPEPPSPYPEDVRRQGGIPEGARPLPLDDDDAQATGAPDPEAGQGRAPQVPEGADLGPGADLVAASSGAVRALERDESGGDPFGRSAADPLGEDELSTAAAEALAGASTPTPADPRIPEGARALDVGTARSEGPPQPTWEQPDMFVGEDDEPEEEDETADEAYDLDEDEDLDLDLAAELEEDEGDDEEDYEYEEEGELEEEEGDFEDEDEDEDEGLEEAAELEDDADDLDEEEDLDEAAELEDEDEEDEELDEAAELDEDEEDDELDEAAELDEDEEELEEDEDLDEAAELEDETDELDEDEDEAEEEEPAEAAELEEDTEPPRRTAAARDGHPGDEDPPLAHAERPARPAAGTRAAGSRPADPSDEDDEPDAILTPARPPHRSREELVRQAGELFLEQGRVAVSLLQRRFGLDFDSACEVLDELQERGLIGPYMGGQRRDILLTLEEWKGRVPSP